MIYQNEFVVGSLEKKNTLSMIRVYSKCCFQVSWF